jgi:peptidyl-prolyl cis-trans isomerase SurA
MIKKAIFLIFVTIINFSTSVNSSDLKIITKINAEILTNHDIFKEYRYLELINPSLVSLNKDQKFDLGKKSLINQVIKKNEIKKTLNLNEENELFENYLNNYFQEEFLKKINIENIDELNQKLILNNTYSLKEVKEKVGIELYWNELIFLKFKDRITVDNNKIISEVKALKDDESKEYFLSEIVIKKTKDNSNQNLIKKIKLSIKEIGFNNSANIYSISDTSKYGGKIGWVSEDSLSDSIKIKLNQISENEVTDFINIGNSYVILKLEKIRTQKKIINEKEKIETFIKQQTNKQLNTFSKIYFEKIKMNYSIDEK